MINLAPCFCAGAVEYKSTLPHRTRRKTRHCRTLHPPDANKRYQISSQNTLLFWTANVTLHLKHTFFIKFETLIKYNFASVNFQPLPAEKKIPAGHRNA